MIDWLNDNSGAVQAISAVVLALTLIAVVCYAYQTRKQAKATERMTEEMLESRHGTVLPVLDFVLEDLNLDEIFAIKEGQFPESVNGHIENIGLGPALDVTFQTKLGSEAPRGEKIGFMRVGASSEKWFFHLEPCSQAIKRLGVEYRNAYGRDYKSSREVRFHQQTGGRELGPLMREE